MCGITGYFATPLTQNSGRELLTRQLKALEHRGPDAQGFHLSGDGLAGLAHARLSMIDPVAGPFPLVDPKTQVALTFNGEIYNYIELRRELEKEGHRFQTRTDAEVLLKGYLQWGAALPPRLNGMFAFAIYDPRKKRLICARDPFGQKPFFYSHGKLGFYFSSELTALKLAPSFDSSIDLESLHIFLSCEGFFGEQTIYTGARKLLPGHALTIDDTGISISCFATLLSEPKNIGWKEAIDEAEARLTESVERVVRSDVPIGVLLSGGIDSSLVLMLLRRLYPSRRIQTFHLTSSNEIEFDESSFARSISRIAEADHTEVPVSREELASVALTLPAKLDQPQADAGIVARYFACRAARTSCKALLSGDGSDELFLGYPTFKAQRLANIYRHLPHWIQKCAVRPFTERLKNGSGYLRGTLLAQHFVRGFPAEPSLRNYYWTHAFSPTELQDLLPHPSGLTQTLQLLKTLHAEPSEGTELSRMAHQYQRTFLPDHILCNSDRASMLNSMEIRTPFLDNHVAEFANSLPDDYRLSGFKTKAVLRALLKRYLPSALVDRPKRGFTFPVQSLLQNELSARLSTLCSPETVKKQGLFQESAVTKLLESFRAGRASYRKVWAFYSLQTWLQAAP